MKAKTDPIRGHTSDPVCGMDVDPDATPNISTHAGVTHFFCSPSCKQKFDRDPTRYAEQTPASASPKMAHEDVGKHSCCASGAKPSTSPGGPVHRKDQNVPGSPPSGTRYTCPMHPEIVREGPGDCPICGMALEPLIPTLEEGPNHELIDMSRRFWASAVLSLPLLMLAMADMWHRPKA